MDRYLYYACFEGNKDAVQNFLRFSGAKYVDDFHGDTPLHQACKQGWLDTVDLLIKKYGCNPNVKASRSGQSPLHYACRHGHIDIVKLLIEKYDCDPNVTTKSNRSILHYACDHGHIDIVEYLLNTQHLDPTLRDSHGLEPLDYALRNKNKIDVAMGSCGKMLRQIKVTSDARMIKMLVEHGAKLTKDHVFSVLFSNHTLITDSEAIEIFSLSIRNGTMLWSPNDLNSDGYTALYLACKVNRPTIVNYLLMEAKCDPNLSKVSPLQSTASLKIAKMLIKHGAQVTPELVLRYEAMETAPNKHVLIKLMLTTLNPDDRDSNGYTALHLACKLNRPNVVNDLLTLAKCDPNTNNVLNESPLESTTSLKIAKMLIKHGARVTPELVLRFEAMETAPNKHALIKLMLTTWSPDDKGSDGYTALHLACKTGNPKPNTVNLLLSVAGCDPNCKSDSEEVPFQLTSDSGVMKMLIKHGATVTADVVFIMLSSKKHIVYSNYILNSLMLTTWNPNERDVDGHTILHVACKANDPDIVNLLLTVAHCDPNIKNSSEEVPLHVTTNPDIIKNLIRHGAKTSIMYESYQKPLKTNKPIQPPVKVFIVGNPSVGKSTLTAALKTEKFSILARILSEKVSGVDKKTVGIVPHDLESDKFGRVTIYDFAGHREFYSGHAALLQTAIQSTPPVFILVINISEDNDEIIKNILYWISFLENQCASVICKPHIILVGSHADILSGINPTDKVKTVIAFLGTKCFTNMEYIGFVTMNCQYPQSTGMNDLRILLIKSCEELRIQEPITFNAHCFLVFLIDTFINLRAVTINNVYAKIKCHQSKGVLEFLPQDIEALYKICLELNDRGHILLLKDRKATENSYIVIDKDFLLSKVSGTVFAPEGFRQHKELSIACNTGVIFPSNNICSTTNTGVVPLSRIANCFPEFSEENADLDLNILIAFLTHLEFCHEISDQILHQLISEQYSLDSNEHYYLFPGLISMKADETVWQSQSTEYDYNFGWILKCIHLEQFFTSRFLQVLLLRLAFLFALETAGDNFDEDIGIHRNCYIWKNGIFWGNVLSMQTLVEVTSDNKSVVLLLRFRIQKANLLQCIQHRSQVISAILQCKEQFCPRVIVTESFVDSSSPLQYPLHLSDEVNIQCTIQNLATAVMTECECPSVVFPCCTKPVRNFLSYEPYLEMKLSTMQTLWNEIEENDIISERFISTIIQQTSEQLLSLIEVIIGSTPNSAKDEIYQDFLQWRDSDMDNQKTYCDLRQLVDKYSVFVGRNILKLAKQKIKLKGSEYEREQVERHKLIVQGNKPEMHELQMLKSPDGRVLRIMESVSSQWKQMAVALGFSIEKIKSIEKSKQYQTDDASFEIFSCWLEGGHDLKPPTWDTLISCLKQANLLDIADRLCNIEIDKGVGDLHTTLMQEQLRNETEVPNGDRYHGAPFIKLNIRAFEVIEGRRGRKINIIETIGSEWVEVAKALDMGQEDIDIIRSTHSDNDEEACHEMIATWLEGNNGEVSWTAFIQVLIDAGLSQLADDLKGVLRSML